MVEPLSDHEETTDEQKLQANYRSLFNTEDGKLVLRDLMTQFHIWANVTDDLPHIMIQREGERSVVLYIMNMMQEDKRIPADLLQEKANAEHDEF